MPMKKKEWIGTMAGAFMYAIMTVAFGLYAGGSLISG